MKRVLIATTIVVVATVAAAAAAVAASTAPARSDASRGGSPCVPKVIKIKGLVAAVNCGPATATLRIGAKTYTFKNGYCKGPAEDGLTLDLGTDVAGPGDNAGLPSFRIIVVKNVVIAIAAYYGGKDLTNYGGKYLTGSDLGHAVSTNALARGMFNSRLARPSFTGTWNCHRALTAQ